MQQEVVEFGKQAVLHYRDMEVITGENRIPEGCLGLFIASKFIARHHWNARVEVPYTELLRRLGISGADLTGGFGGRRADIAVFQDQKPVAIVELKIIDEGRGVGGVREDWVKIRNLMQRVTSSGVAATLDGYVGALVCDISRGSKDTCAEQTVEGLKVTLGTQAVYVGDRVPTKSGGSGWIFICAEVH